MAAQQLTILLGTLGFLVSIVTARTYYIVQDHISCPTETTRPTGSGSHHVKSTDHTPLDEDCLTLTQYAQSPATTIHSNITLIFEPGHHTLDSRLQIQNVINLVLRVEPINSSPGPVAMVKCTNSSGFDFAAISEVSVSGLEFSGCQENSVRSLNQLRIDDCRFQDGHGMELMNVRSTTFERSSFISLTAFRETSLSFHFGQNVHVSSGGAIVAYSSAINVTECLFKGNSAGDSFSTDGAIWTEHGSVSIHDSNFSNNTAVGDGGAVGTVRGSVNIHGSNFSSNTAGESGGTIWTYSGSVNIYHSNFSSNTAGGGGAIWTKSGSVCISNSEFNRNTAENLGGVIGTGSGCISIHASAFSSNTVGAGQLGLGGAIMTDSGNVSIHGTDFTNNTAGVGGAIGTLNGKSISIHSTNFSSNIACITGGAVVPYQGRISIEGSYFTNNTAALGGAIRTDSGILVIIGSFFIRNTALNHGGALYLGYGATDTDKINNSIFSHSNAVNKGGAIYAWSRTLNLNGLLQITNNSAQSDGGGIYAISSTIKVTEGWLEFIENRAEKGGGIYLESDAQLQLIKSVPECSSVHYNPHCMKKSMSSLRLHFTNNSAQYGGALYISDDTLQSTECLIQDLASHNVSYPDLIVQNTYFTNNSANISGASIFGGLLDRCSVSPSAQVFNKYQNTFINATSYLTEITNLRTNSILQSEISSEPVRVCLCTDEQPDCDKPPITYTFKKTTQTSFSVSVVAVDQVRNSLPSSVRALSSNAGGLAEGEAIQNTTSNCTDLNYTISFPRDSEQLAFSPKNQNVQLGNANSQIIINMVFVPCTCLIGFVPDRSTCNCVCDPCLSNYITDCSVGNSSVKRSNNVWISYINKSNNDILGYQNETQCPYITYPHCPFDYCHPASSPVWINLNTPNSSDTQCAFNRIGKLCGSCKDGFSLSLGSSRCLSCSNNQLALLIVFAIAGIALVAFLLAFNLTVAVGTINGLIFYANILTTNHATFFPFQSPNFFTVFIAWLNLDFGFVTCFFDGMDSYIKEWLQLAFPIYIIFLVTMVIIGCESSTRIARLFTGTNPVATLATLILLSYTKSLRVIIAAFSSATLEYPDGSKEIVWLIDAHVHFLKGKHIPLFLVALFVLLVGIVYTSLLFTYQWLLRCPNRMIKILKNARFYPFMDAYLAPYNIKHHYWTGLLLLIRAFLYITAALNVSGDPGNNLLSIICTLVSLFVLQMVVQVRIYKSWSRDVLEKLFFCNLMFFSVGSLYIRGTSVRNQESLAYTSSSVAFISFLAIMTYHTYAFAIPRKARIKLDSFILKMKLQFTKQEPTVPEIILVPRPAVTYSVVDMPTQKQLLENMEKATTAAIAERESEETQTAENDLAPNTEQSSASLVSKQTSDDKNSTSKQRIEFTKELSDETRMDKDEEKNTLDIKLEPRPSAFSDICLDPYIRDSDKIGTERETEIKDFIEVAD